MKGFKDLKIRVKLIAGYSAVAALMVLMGLNGLKSLKNMQMNFGRGQESKLKRL